MSRAKNVTALGRFIPDGWRVKMNDKGDIIDGFCPYITPQAEPTTVLKLPTAGKVAGLDQTTKLDSKEDGLTVADVVQRMNSAGKVAFTVSELSAIFGYSLAQPVKTRLIKPAWDLLGVLAKSGRVMTGGSGRPTINKAAAAKESIEHQRTAEFL